MLLSQQISERLPHRLQIRTRAMDHHDRRSDRIAPPDVENVERGAGDLDRPALGGMGALQDKDTGPRDQRQNDQRRHGNYRNH